jgi:hypothetical protein
MLDLGDKNTEVAWVDGELGELGIHLNALMLVGLRLALSKNVPPAEFTGNFVSGYIFGALGALEDQGKPVIDELIAKIPPPPQPEEEEDEDDEDDDVQINATMLEISVRPTPKEFVDMKGIGKHLRATARSVGASFEDPGDDWLPILMVSNEKDTAMIGFEIPDDTKLKYILFTRVLPRVIKTELPKPQRVAFLSSVWTLGEIKPGSEADVWMRNRGPDEQISDRDDRKEALVLYLLDKEGTKEIWYAEIERHDDSPPTLGRWRKAPEGHSEGAIVSMIKKVLG